jgi:Phasin protein
MSSADKNKPPGNPAQRSRKAKLASKKPDQRQRPKPEQQPDRRQHEKELIEAHVASTESFPIEADAATGKSSIGKSSIDKSSIDKSSIGTPSIDKSSIGTPSIGTPSIGTAVALTEAPSKGALVPIDAFPIAAAVPVDIFLTGFQTIANAYREHARRSLEQTLFFVEKFSAVRSLDRAAEIQTEFAKEACETFAADSQRILRLYSELGRQVLRPFERLMTRVTQTAR